MQTQTCKILAEFFSKVLSNMLVSQVCVFSNPVAYTLLSSPIHHINSDAPCLVVRLTPSLCALLLILPLFLLPRSMTGCLGGGDEEDDAYNSERLQ